MKLDSKSLERSRNSNNEMEVQWFSLALQFFTFRSLHFVKTTV